ncbi:Asp23/Gls24 family envelope stress response protein [Limosilactobacillus difficilis]|uniref:Asp23/Gls24 family envelope stress response protein n=1 Tax=Limosilactobacillus difficilis TaxID=2991838 RepID=UPI0024BA5241|nr:Asp23/Gls24 family envelope stress response protein [Limosilactobacillus difficilis]
MARDTNIVLSNEDQSLGKIEMSPRVLEIIAGIAASEIKGVVKMHGSFSNGVGQLLGHHSSERKGVKLFSADDAITIDVDVYVAYGVSVPKIAAEIQDKVKQQLQLMTNLKPREVNVHVQGIIPVEKENKVDQNDIFGLHANEEENEED